MSAVIPNVLSPARVTQALAAVGPPAGSGGLRISSTDPMVSAGHVAFDPHRPGTAAGHPRTPSPSRIAATTLPTTPDSATISDSAPFPPTSATPASNAGGGGSGGCLRRPSGSGTGEAGSGTTCARNLNAARARGMTAAGRSFHTRPDSPRASTPAGGGGGGRVQLAAETSSTSLSTGAHGGVASPVQRAYLAAGSSTRSHRSLARDRSFASTTGSNAGQFRHHAGSMNGGYVAGLDSIGSAAGLGGGGGGGFRPMGLGSLTAAPGTVGGIDLARLVAIQKILDEYDSDEDGGGGESGATGPTSPLGDGSGHRLRRDSATSAGGESGRARGSDTGSSSGLRTLVSLRSRRDMQHWQPSVSAVKGSLEEHQQRLRERADVTQSLRKWTEQVLEEARRAASGSPSSRESEIARVSSVRFKDSIHPASGTQHSQQQKQQQQQQGEAGGGGGGTAALGGFPAFASAATAMPAGAGAGGGVVAEPEFLDPEQELDDEEERRLEALRALPPNPRGLGAQLRAHFMAVVEDEVTKKFEAMRVRWEADRGLEAEELRELRESYRELRRTHLETRDALDRANSRLELLRLQIKAGSNKAAGKEPAAEADGAGGSTARSGTRGGGHRSSHDGGHEGKGKKGGGGGGGRGGGHGQIAEGAAEPSTSTSPLPGAYGFDDELHDKLHSIGNRRAASPNGDGAAAAAVLELQQQLRAHSDAAATLNRKLQDAEQQVTKLRLDNAVLEQRLTVARSRTGSPEPGGAGAGDGGDGGGVSSSKYDTDIQFFKLKQEKAALEQQLAAATARKAGGKGAGGGGKGGKAGGGGRSSFSAAAVGSAGGKGGAAAASARADVLAAEVERLRLELGAARQNADTSAHEAVERRLELHKAKEDLTTTQATLELALQQVAGVKDSVVREKERADRAAAAAEAAEAAQAAAEASAAAANAAAAAALIKRSAATGEVQELLERLQRDRDAASAAAAEAREQLRELSKTLSQRSEEVMHLRDQLLQRQLEQQHAATPAAAATDAGASPGAAAEPPHAQAPLTTASSLPSPRPSPPPAAAAAAAAVTAGNGNGGDLSIDAKVTAAAVAAMQSLGVALRPVAPSLRRRPTSALGSSGAAAAAGPQGAVGVAAAAAAAAALVPAVLMALRRRVPEMVLALGSDLAEDSAEAALPPRSSSEAGSAAAADAAAAAAAAAGATLRESGNAAAAAAAGATAAAPVIATAFVDLVRAELLHGDHGATTALDGLVAAAGQRFRTTASGGGGADQAQIYHLTALGSDGFHSTTSALPSGIAIASGDGSGGGGIGGGYAAAAAAAASAAVSAGSYSGGAAVPPVLMDGVTFYPLGVKDAARAPRRPAIPSSAATPMPSGAYDAPPLPSGSPPLRPGQLPHHTPYFEAAAAAVAAAAAASHIPQSVSVPVHSSRRPSALSAAAARRRRSAFAQLHSSYFAPGAAAAETEAEAGADSDSQPPTSSTSLPLPMPLPSLDSPTAAAEDGDAALPPSPNHTRAARSAGLFRDGGGSGAVLNSYGSVYVDPELASVLHVERVSAAAARAAGAGRGAISPEALGPSLRDRALVAVQAPEPLPPPRQRPLSAAVRTLDAARQHILQGGSGSGDGNVSLGGAGAGRYQMHFLRPMSAALPPLAGAVAVPEVDAAPAAVAAGFDALSEQQQQLAQQAFVGSGLHTPQHPQHHPHRSGGGLTLAGTGAKVRALTANPQKGIQLPARPRGAPSRGGVAGRAGEGVRFEDPQQQWDAEAAATAARDASVSGRLLAGALGLSPPMRELQLHTAGPRGIGGPLGPAATYQATAEAAAAAAAAGTGVSGGDSDAVPELPSSGPELAALARDLMAAQERALRDLEDSMNTRRELAEEVVTSRQQWLQEARRARVLERELEGVRKVLVSLGIGAPASASSSIATATAATAVKTAAAAAAAAAVASSPPSRGA